MPSAKSICKSLIILRFLVVAALSGIPNQTIAAEPKQQKENAERPNAISSPDPTASDSVQRNALGDPLPAGALLRLGTLRFRSPSGVTDIALSPDNKTLVTVGGQVIAWNTETGRERWRVDTSTYNIFHTAAGYGIRSVAFSSDGSHFFTPGERGRIQQWGTASIQLERLRFSVKALDEQQQRVIGDNPFEGANPFGEADGPSRGQSKSIDVTADEKLFAIGDTTGLYVCRRDGWTLYQIPNKLDPAPGLNNDDRLTFGGQYSYGRFSPDGKTLAAVVSEAPKAIRLVEAEKGDELRRIDATAKIVRMAFTPDSKRIATTERDKAVRLYDCESGKEVWSTVLELNNPYENYTSAIAISPDGKTVAAGATDNAIYLFDAATGKQTGRLGEKGWYPWALAFTSDSKILYSAGWDGAIRRWDVAAGSQMPLPQGVHASSAVAASPDGRWIVFRDDDGVAHLVDPKTGKEQKKFHQPGERHSVFAFSPNSRLLAAGGTSADKVCVTVWNIDDGKVAQHWEWPKGKDPHSDVECLSFSPDGKHLAAAVFRQSKAYIWNLQSSEQVGVRQHQEVYGLSFSPDSKTVATAGWDQIVRFWDIEAGKLQSKFDVKADRVDGGDVRMYAVCYSPGGETFATAHLDGTVRVWQTDDLQLRTEFKVPGRFVYGAMSFSPDGLWLATGGMDGSVVLWDPSTGKSVWDVGKHQGHVYTVGFGRDWQTMVSGGEDGACYLWNLEPSWKITNNEPGELWEFLAAESGSPATYAAMWQLAAHRQNAVKLLAEKLRPVKAVIDLDQIIPGITSEEADRRKSLSKSSIAHHPEVQCLLAVRRGIAVLEQIRTKEAVQLLNDLVKQEPNGKVAALAGAALHRIETNAVDNNFKDLKALQNN